MKAQIAQATGMDGFSVSQHEMARHWTIRKALLASGILAPLLYITANEVIAAAFYPGYNRITQPISELSATFAPSKPILDPLIFLYQVLMIAFGAGVWQAAPGKRALRVISGIFIAGSTLGLVAFAFPMTHLDLNDIVHNILSGVMPILSMFLTSGFGAASLGKRFRLYSILTLGVVVLAAVFIVMQTAQIAAGNPVSWFGISERILTYVWMLWVAVLASALLRSQPDQSMIDREFKNKSSLVF